MVISLKPNKFVYKPLVLALALIVLLFATLVAGGLLLGLLGSWLAVGRHLRAIEPR